MHEWITHLTTKFDAELEAAWQRETWEVVRDGNHSHAAIVWDLFALFLSTFDVFFSEFEQMSSE